MTRSQLAVSVIATLLLTIGAGVLHGRLSGRWGVSTTIQQAGSQLDSLPREFGPWRSEQSRDLGSDALVQLEPYGYVNRVYVNSETNDAVECFVLMGRVGPTAVHTPEICYPSRHFTRINEKEKFTLRVDSHRADEFWATTFRCEDIEGGYLKVYYGWSDGTSWEASSGTRFEFAGLPYLYKLQLSTRLPSDPGSGASDPCQKFLADLLPVLRPKLDPAK